MKLLFIKQEQTEEKELKYTPLFSPFPLVQADFRVQRSLFFGFISIFDFRFMIAVFRVFFGSAVHVAVSWITATRLVFVC